MRKDIIIPQTDDVYMAMVYEFNDVHRTMDWYAYLVNESDMDLETVLITSTGWISDVKSSELKHKIDHLPKQSFAKVEYVLETLLEVMHNQFFVTFFADGKMYDKTFVFKKNTAIESKLENLSFLDKKGVICK